MRKKLPWILLAISVALNIFAVAGFFYAKSQAEMRMLDRSPVMAAARELNLTEPQKAAFEKMRNDIRRASDDIRAEMRPVRRQLLDELAKPQPDFAAADQRIDDLGDIQGKRFKAMVRAVHEFQQSLTPQQQEQFRKAMREQMTRRAMQRGRPGNDDSRQPRPR